MVIGGYAVLFHGEPRLTEDIDIVLGCDADKLNLILEVVSHQFNPRCKNVKDFVSKTNVLPLVAVKNDLRVDLIFSFIKFERDAIQRALSTEVNGKTIKIARAEDLIIYKLLSARPRDIEDIKNIINNKSDEINFSELNKMVNRFSSLMNSDQILKEWNKLKDEI